MRLAVQGYYGYGNLGDDLMLYLLLEQVRRRGWVESVRVLYKPDADPGRIAVPHGLPVELTPVGSWRERFAALRGAEVVVFGGGTCLHRFGFCGLYTNLLAKLLRKKVVWLGVGADEVGGGMTRFKARLAVASCDAITVRDEPSAEIVRKLRPHVRRLEVLDDLAFLVATSPDLATWMSGPAPLRRSLCVGWRDLRGYLSSADERRAVESAATAIAEVATERRLSLVRVIDIADLIDGPANESLVDALRRRLPSGCRVQHDRELDMEQKVRAIASAEASVFARLHGLFLGKLAGRSSVGVAYASKTSNFGDQLDRPPVVPLNELLKSPAALGATLRRELDEPSQFIVPLDEHLRRAEGHLDVLQSTLRAA